MEVIHGNNKNTTDRDLLKELPPCSRELSPKAKSEYQKIGTMLIEAGLLKTIHLMPLELLATDREQWLWSVKAMAAKNKKKMGSGFVQVYGTGATNITSEMVVYQRSRDAIIKDVEMFGLSPIHEKKLKKEATDPAQLDMFNQFKSKHAQ